MLVHSEDIEYFQRLYDKYPLLRIVPGYFNEDSDETLQEMVELVVDDANGSPEMVSLLQEVLADDTISPMELEYLKLLWGKNGVDTTYVWYERPRDYLTHMLKMIIDETLKWKHDRQVT